MRWDDNRHQWWKLIMFAVFGLYLAFRLEVVIGLLRILAKK